MSIKKKVFARLKTKAASFGFNREELHSIAANIADNVDSEEEEPTEEEIDAQIDAALPFLKVGQQFAQRVAKTKTTPTTTGDDDDDDDPSATAKNPKKKTTGDDEPGWFKAYRETQEARFAKLEGEKTTLSRKSKLETLLKDSGKFGERTLKAFGRMKFETDEEFEEFLSEVEEDLEDHNKEAGEEALGTITNPPGKSGGNTKKGKELSDKEIEEIANMVS